MKNQQKISEEQQKIINDLYSTDDQIVSKTIKDLRNKGGVFAIKPLMEVYFSTSSAEISTAAFSIIRDLKASQASVIISENIIRYSANDKISDFISALWQSAVKFDNLKVFVEIFVGGNDKTSLEIVTLIQQNAYLLNDDSRKECLDVLKYEIGELNSFKKALIVDLLEVFE